MVRSSSETHRGESHAERSAGAGAVRGGGFGGERHRQGAAGLGARERHPRLEGEQQRPDQEVPGPGHKRATFQDLSGARFRLH